MTKSPAQTWTQRSSDKSGGIWTSLAVLALGPAAWIVQLTVDFGLAQVFCEPTAASRPVPPMPGLGLEQAVLLLVNLLCLAAAATGGGLAWAALWRSRRDHPGAKEVELKAAPARRRFLAICGLLGALAFMLAILFDTAWPLFVPTCWRFAL